MFRVCWFDYSKKKKKNDYKNTFTATMYVHFNKFVLLERNMLQLNIFSLHASNMKKNINQYFPINISLTKYQIKRHALLFSFAE